MERSTRDFLIVIVVLQGIMNIFFAIKIAMIESSLANAFVHIGRLWMLI